jgi:hypothetical protein
MSYVVPLSMMQLHFTDSLIHVYCLVYCFVFGDKILPGLRVLRLRMSLQNPSLSHRISNLSLRQEVKLIMSMWSRNSKKKKKNAWRRVRSLRMNGHGVRR